MRLVLAPALAAAALAGAAPAGAELRTDPPYNIPSQPAPSPQSGPSIPLVAALMLPKGQKLGVVLRRGLQLRVYAYKAIHLSVSATLAPATARRVHVSPRTPAIRHKALKFDKPGVYQVRARLTHRVVTRLRHARRAKLRLRTALQAAGNQTSTVSPVSLAR